MKVDNPEIHMLSHRFLLPNLASYFGDNEQYNIEVNDR
jgi:hypothetical protein